MELGPVNSSDQLIERAIEIARGGRKMRVAVAAAQDVQVLEAVSQAAADGILDAVLIGDADEIHELADRHNIELSGFDIVDENDVVAAARTAADLATSGDVQAVVKGLLPTSTLLKVVLDRQYNLRVKDTISHCAVLDIPGYHKLLNMTDGGVVVKPDREQKFQILESAVQVTRALGLSPVKVAVSGAYDKPLERMSHAYSDLDFIIPQAMGKLDDVLIQGPLPFDLATSKQVADPSQAEGTVVGDADIYLVDSIEECNIIAKSLIQFARAMFAGVIVGAKVPVALVSRTNAAIHKKASLALACVLSDYYQRTNIWNQRSR